MDVRKVKVEWKVTPGVKAQDEQAAQGPLLEASITNITVDEGTTLSNALHQLGGYRFIAFDPETPALHIAYDKPDKARALPDMLIQYGLTYTPREANMTGMVQSIETFTKEFSAFTGKPAL